jgi:signal transduction histidine kinase
MEEILRDKTNMSKSGGTNKQSEGEPIAPLTKGFFEEIDVDFLVHELKGPMAVIEAGIRTLLERPDKFGPLSEKQKRTLERSLRNSRKAGEILHELLEIGRAESGCFVTSVFRPAEVIFSALKDAVETISARLADIITPEQSQSQIVDALRREDILFEASPKAAKIEILQDHRKLGHIAGNLIKNALHHRKKRVEIVVDIEKEGLVLDVKDDGPGVPPAFQEKIFMRYIQAEVCSGVSRSGHGLGLAGARVLARCLGGDIFLKNEIGYGAVFRFIMPIPG